ncbi:MAG: DUF1656 domain-containing protein [Methylacidiphilales bacterium]|nr:DUF1656 domain-containing protein [Candidatus Methylacidiphilales bacterium]
MKEINLFGVYFSPFVAVLALALIIFFALRVWLDRIEVQKWFWHRSLFDAAVFVIILSVIGLMF